MLRSVSDDDTMESVAAIEQQMSSDKFTLDAFVKKRRESLEEAFPAPEGYLNKGNFLQQCDDIWVRSFTTPGKNKKAAPVLRLDLFADEIQGREAWTEYCDETFGVLTGCFNADIEGPWPAHILARTKLLLYWHPKAKFMPMPMLTVSFVRCLDAYFKLCPFALSEVSHYICTLRSTTQLGATRTLRLAKAHRRELFRPVFIDIVLADILVV